MRYSTWTTLAALLAALLATACDDDEGGGTPRADAVAADAAPADVEPPAEDATSDASVGAGLLEAEPDSLDFGIVGVGGQGNGSVVVRNVGDAPVSVTAFAFQGPFSTSRQPPLNIPAGAERTLEIVFAPDMEGEIEGALILAHDAGEQLTVSLRGVGARAEAMLLTDAIQFQNVAPGEPAADFIRVRNTSDAVPLGVRAVRDLAAPFEVPQGQVPQTVPPMADGQVLVQFLPDAEGSFEQVVTLVTDAGEFPVTLRGRAVAVGDLTVTGVEPAWAPADVATTVVVHGGPFARVPDSVLFGEQALADLELIDEERVRGVLPAGGEPGAVDVRVVVGGSFGLQPTGFVITPPVAEGSALDAAAVAAGTVTPAGNPWRLAVDEIPDGAELTLEPGTVILADGRTLTVRGVLISGGEGAPVVFSAEDATPGAWGGLRFAAAPTSSSLTATVVEYAGAGGEPAIAVAQAPALNRVAIRQSGGDGVRVEAGGQLAMLSGQLTDLAGDGMSLPAPDGGLFRLQMTRVRRVRWPVLAHPAHFRQPLGPGNDWADNEFEGIGIGGEVTGEAHLANQPAGITYRLREPLRVAAGGRLSLAGAAPLLLDRAVTVAGRLELAPGLRIQAAAGGALTIEAGAALVAPGVDGMPIVFEARAAGGEPQPGAWGGVQIAGGGELDVSYLTVRDAGAAAAPALRLTGQLGDLSALTVEDAAAVGLHLAGRGELHGVTLRGNAGGTSITGGNGRITGSTTDAVAFEPVDLCGNWDLSGLMGPGGGAVETNCP